ncbi:MAG: hypothetical protein HQK51_11215 [Oligoflexia bacterium]|nr:hypothetical protein [Oligoflexia bacterium]
MLTLYDNPILLSLILFSFALLLHIIVWQIFRPKKKFIFLLLLFIILPSVLVFILLAGEERFLYAFSLVNLFGLSYILTYPAIHTWSPSLYMIYLISRSDMKYNLNDLLLLMNENLSIDNRIEDIFNDKFVKKESKKSKESKQLSLTILGKVIAFSFILFRKIVGLK